MEKLIVVKGQLEGREFDLMSGKITIGRDEKRDITLPESLVSRQHATLEKKGNDWFLTDDGSANGTSVNGGRITTHKLINGDRVEIGNFVLQYVASTVAAAPSPADSDRTVMLGDGEDLAVAPPKAAPPPPPPKAAAPPPPPPPPAAKAAPPPPPPPPAPAATAPAAKAEKPSVKVDSTIYISDDLPAADFAAFAPAAPAKGKGPASTQGRKIAPAAEAAEKPKSKLGLIIVIVLVLFLFFFALVAVGGYVAYTKGLLPIKPASFSTPATPELPPADGGTAPTDAPTESPAETPTPSETPAEP
ncbi:MAG: FHA domain-containing protein [Acidobacteriota bacterium]